MPRVKKQIEVVNIEDDEDYITARTKLDKHEDKIEDKIEDKVEDKLPCPDCGRLVSKKTLRYTHKYQCPSKSLQNIKQRKVEQPSAKDPLISKPTATEMSTVGNVVANDGSAAVGSEAPNIAPFRGDVMQSRRAPIRRYEHINLF